MAETARDLETPLPFDTDPSRYVHWQLALDGPVARLKMNVKPDRPLAGDYVLKLNSYDLGVDIELADAVQRIRFSHPEVRTLVITSAQDRIFCSGANIYMLGSSTHAFKVNFCKYTNETRLHLEELAEESQVRTVTAINGTASGGGYELALATERIVLVDDGSSAVSFPETPLLGVLPGTGGLTRLVDKRKVRRDRADVFSTLVEGIRGKRAVEWGLVDELVPRSKWEDHVARLAAGLAETTRPKAGPGIALPAIAPAAAADRLDYRHVSVAFDRSLHTAHLTVRGPTGPEPKTAEELRERGAEAWVIRAFRELDDALLRLRFLHPTVGLLALHTEGDPKAVLAAERVLLEDHWLAKEARLLARRTLKRLDNTSRSLFALVEPGSCFAGSLLELLLAADRSYMLADPKRPTALFVSALNGGPLGQANGLTRLETRFLAEPARAKACLAEAGAIDAERADELGLVTFTPDEIDWEDEVRLAIEERANFSPDALTGMENNLRFAGPETLETKIFGRLSAWQNWIFIRPNAVGEKGALTSYGKQTRPEFDRRRT